MQNSRKTLIPVFEVAAVVVVVLDVALGFAAMWARRQRDAAYDSLKEMRLRVAAERARIASLESFQAQLPDAEDQLKQFLDGHIPPRREGFSEASGLVRDLALKAGVQFNGIQYKLDTKQESPYFLRIGMDVGLDGAYGSLVNFCYQLETADDFVVVRNLVFTTGEGGKLGLKVSADLYITP